MSYISPSKIKGYIKNLSCQIAKLVQRVEDLEDSGGDAINDDPIIPESSSKISYNVQNYASLLVVATAPEKYEFAYVREAQGISWLPGSMGGTYYGVGLYMYDGVNWVESNENIHAALNGLTAYTFTDVNYTVLSIDRVVGCINTITIDLPTAVGILGKEYTIKNEGTGTITIDGNGAETIDGNLTINLVEQYIALTLVSNGTNWIII